MKDPNAGTPGDSTLWSAAVFTAIIAGLVTAQVPESAFDRDPWPTAKQGPLKVFILAGQSNMQGHAALRTLEYLIYNRLGAGGKRGAFQAAQQAVADLPEFQGNVTCVKTCEFWEPEVAAMVDQSVHKGTDWSRFYNVGSNRGYHYLGSGRIYTRMGKAFAEAMLKLQEDQQ
ncbi:MAG: hypothetical protein IH892_04310 [Planctomycetes bacterium]|nr:hypothetical protein [Planctomycetota bacterium]